MQVVLLATAYVVRAGTGNCDAYTSRTADGSRADYGVVAVSPHQFRFGTKFRIPGYGVAIAHDTGGDIHYGRMDVAMLSCRAAFAWGARTVKVDVLADR